MTDYVVNASSGELVDDPAFSTANGALVRQNQSNAGSNTPWTLVPLADGNDEIVNASTGKVLDDPAFSTSNGTFVDQWQLNGGTNQQWTLVPLADGNDEIVNAFSHKVLDDPAFSRANGTRIQQYQPNGGMNQQWVLFVPQSPATTSPNWVGLRRRNQPLPSAERFGDPRRRLVDSPDGDRDEWQHRVIHLGGHRRRLQWDRREHRHLATDPQRRGLLLRLVATVVEHRRPDRHVHLHDDSLAGRFDHGLGHLRDFGDPRG